MLLENGYTIILPTLNEAQNVGVLIKKLLELYGDIFIIVTDDGSIDNTKAVVLSCQSKRITFLDRKDEKIHGLTASILDATRMVKTRYFIVMDGDMQHPWQKVGDIVNSLQKGVKLIIASRERVENPWPASRKYVSYLGNFLGKLSLLIRGRGYLSYDVLTGFFGVETDFWKRIVFEENKAAGFRLRGYKILFDFLKVIPLEAPIKDIHYVFGSRKTGASKLNVKVYVEFLKALFL